MNEVIIASAVRTPIGAFQGNFRDMEAVELGAVVMEEACKRANIASERIDQVYMGQVLQAGIGMNGARQAAVKAGIPVCVPATNVNLVCGSGMQAVMLGAQCIRSGDAGVIMAGGMENMTHSPYLLKQARQGYRYGHGELVDSVLLDGLTCAIIKHPMGVTAERLAERYGLTREQQDAFALQSQQRAEAAMREGRFEEETVAISIADRKGSARLIATDEHPRPGLTMEALGKLKPAFSAQGTVTAGNSSGINDGGAAVVLCSSEAAAAHQLAPIASIRGYAAVGLEPEWMGLGPVPAIKQALLKAGLRLQDIGLFEINEAFAAQALAVMHELELEPERVNVNGGAIALGHPIGASGTRVLVTLIHEMQRRQVRYGAAALCVGGGHGVAVVVERG
ncbi:acetyl-CoA C-acetyltransferase [Paenibacillus sp. MER TA 81-3]|uniref:acetyl-CoA C-acetyltransferase n=1 Tax=Paenibacillus sp. MER TA 81-3 TaxID=2939573 RepID=UPI0020424CEB|nr:acetyl-CoA C-acetyltransferase [Paenibacillus sp. MER TA 81-3]MCM3338910.1 acetyl-CoA C-acetyltransferase [Paenibacillus sp. MER TA 81-3]